MSAVKGSIYQRGPYWLDLPRAAGGKPASANWYIFWYSPERGCEQRRSTRTSDVRLACKALDEHYLANHQPTEDDRASYGVADAMADYYIEHGQHQPSAPACKAQLKLLTRWMVVEQEAGRLPVPFMPTHINANLIDRFRKWGLADPIVARRKDDDGNWVDGKSRPRAASTVEESVIRLKAVLNHALRNERIAVAPYIAHKTRAKVTPKRTYRLSVEAIGELLDYTMKGDGKYAGHAGRLLPLRRYLIAAICTLARPDAIFDMSIARDRGQWWQNERCFDLNPLGRIQTKKVRPVVPVVGLLHSWLQNTDEWFVSGERTVWDAKQQVDVIEQYKVASVKSGWDSAREALGIPMGWGPKLIRHSMASILAMRRVDLVELEMMMGHRVLSATTSIYTVFDPSYLASIRVGIEDVISDLTRMSGQALLPKLFQNSPNVHVLRA